MKHVRRLPAGSNPHLFPRKRNFRPAGDWTQVSGDDDLARMRAGHLVPAAYDLAELWIRDGGMPRLIGLALGTVFRNSSHTYSDWFDDRGLWVSHRVPGMGSDGPATQHTLLVGPGTLTTLAAVCAVAQKIAGLIAYLPEAEAHQTRRVRGYQPDRGDFWPNAERRHEVVSHAWEVHGVRNRYFHNYESWETQLEVALGDGDWTPVVT